MALRSRNSRMRRFFVRIRGLRGVRDFLFAEVIVSPSLIINSTTTIVLSAAALSLLAAARIASGKKLDTASLSVNRGSEARENFLAESL
jgi:hypothetical protein